MEELGKELLAELKLLRLVLNRLDEYAIFTLDNEGMVTRAYHGVAAVLGYEEQEFVGQPGATIFTNEDRALGKPDQEMASARHLGKTVNERWHVKKDKTLFWGSGFMFHLRDENDNPIGFLKIVRDITGRKQAEDQIRNLNHELEERVKERTSKLNATVQRLESFCYTVAHDLRAPLRQMAGFADIISEDDGAVLSSQSKEHLRRIKQASSRLDALIIDLLGYVRVGQIELKQQRIDLSTVLQNVLQELKSEIRGKAAQITIEEPLHEVLGEASVLQHIIVNLLSNALKFVPPEVAPRIRVYSECNGDRVKLWVEDNGIGIAPEYQERIFKIFERLHTSADYEGTGVGLAIVAGAIERMDGRVGVESEQDKGSKFWIELRKA